MKTYRKLFLVIVALVFAFAGCKKYSDGPSFSPWPKKIRLDKTWKIDSYVASGVTQTVSGGDTYQFKSNGDYICTSGSISVTGKWEWGSKKESVKITIGSSTDETKILKLTSKELWTTDDNGATEVHFVSSK